MSQSAFFDRLRSKIERIFCMKLPRKRTPFPISMLILSLHPMQNQIQIFSDDQRLIAAAEKLVLAALEMAKSAKVRVCRSFSMEISSFSGIFHVKNHVFHMQQPSKMLVNIEILEKSKLTPKKIKKKKKKKRQNSKNALQNARICDSLRSVFGKMLSLREKFHISGPENADFGAFSRDLSSDLSGDLSGDLSSDASSVDFSTDSPNDSSGDYSRKTGGKRERRSKSAPKRSKSAPKRSKSAPKRSESPQNAAFSDPESAYSYYSSDGGSGKMRENGAKTPENAVFAAKIGGKSAEGADCETIFVNFRAKQ
jgi:hypothetical protein